MLQSALSCAAIWGPSLLHQSLWRMREAIHVLLDMERVEWDLHFPSSLERSWLPTAFPEPLWNLQGIMALAWSSCLERQG